jgi:hypothetical protein
MTIGHECASVRDRQSCRIAHLFDRPLLDTPTETTPRCWFFSFDKQSLFGVGKPSRKQAKDWIVSVFGWLVRDRANSRADIPDLHPFTTSSPDEFEGE